MADLPIPREDFGVEPPMSVLRKWLDVEIQQVKSRVSSTRQSIEDLKCGEVVKLEAILEMLELKLQNLEDKRQTVEEQ